jgi:hypothetical protein
MSETKPAPDPALEALTPDELRRLTSATSEVEWNAACDLIKGRRRGAYPAEWFAKVIQSGLLARVSATWAR